MKIDSKQLDALAHYQTIDIETQQIRSDLDKVPEKLNELDRQLQHSQSTIAEKEGVLSELQKEYRSREDEIKSNQEMIRKSNEKLPSVKTNKEYHALLKEIEILKKKNSEIEDRGLEVLNRIEAEEKNITALKEDFNALTLEIKEEKQALEAEGEQRAERLSALQEDLKTIAESIPLNLMTRFNQVRKQTMGLALVAAEKAVCQGCHLNIPPQMYNELQRSDTLQFCPFCHRMIYWKNG